MVADEPSQRDSENEVISPQEADRKGKINIVKGIMNDPEVQGVIKGALIRETVKNTIFMSAFLVGLLKLYDVAKAIINFNWTGDLIISLILMAIGLIYMLRNLFYRGK